MRPRSGSTRRAQAGQLTPPEAGRLQRWAIAIARRGPATTLNSRVVAGPRLRSAASVDVRAAVDVIGGAGDVAGLLPAQVRDEVGDVADPAVAADGDPGDERGLALALQGSAGDVGVDQPGSDRVDRDPVGAQLAGERSGEAEFGGLGGGVGDPAEDAAAPLGRDRGEEHDATEAALGHAGRQAAGDVEGTADVDGEDAVPLLAADLQERSG